MNKEDFKELFLKLTEWTVPYGYESELESLLPSGFKRDSIGNYYYQIGNSETLFTTHLDTYCEKRERVNHIVDGYKISTDGSTILGGDNKLGCAILISMISDGIPGTYYFFIGEEPILSGGTFGSKGALKSNPQFFKKFKRAIAFDRRGYGSIVMRQMGRWTCSREFVDTLSGIFSGGGIPYDEKSDYGYYTDTAVFMDVIPECTNISAGGFNEHYKNEWVDLNYTWKVLNIAKGIDWDKLPIKRELEERFKSRSLGDKLYFKSFKEDTTFKKLHRIISFIDLRLTRKIQTDATYITYSKWLEDYDLDIKISGEDIYIDDVRMDITQFKEWVISNFINDLYSEIVYNLDDTNFLSEFSTIFGSKLRDELVKHANKQK